MYNITLCGQKEQQSASTQKPNDPVEYAKVTMFQKNKRIFSPTISQTQVISSLLLMDRLMPHPSLKY